METTPRIRALPKEISDKIAAGEVVERPLSIIKELMENAIDAGATSIVAEIRNGGKTYIRMTDNGCGIQPQDVELAFHRYATSKINSAEDLNAIETLGFRGEALASIAAVSRVELITRAAGEKAGVRAFAEGGMLRDITGIGAEEGTTIIVSDLFFNTPVRRKFLKTDSAESAMVIDYLSKMTLAYPDIRIRVINNGSILFSTQGKGDVYQNILTVYSRQTANGLLKVDAAGADCFRLRGYISRPDQSRTSRRHQIYFVNGRWVRSKLIDEAIREAYRDKLFEGRYPAAFLMLELSPAQLDVNIHPNKTEIRFLEESTVRGALVAALRQHLLSESAVPSMGDTARSAVPGDNESIQEGGGSQKVNINYISLTNEQDRYEQILSEHMETAAPEAFGETPTTEIQERFLFADLQILGVAFSAYILAQKESTLYLIDQHAAHERVLYEQLMEAIGRHDANSQMMLEPWIVEIPFYLKEAAQERLALLNDFGYHVQEFGPKEYIVKEIPAFMDPREAEAFLNSFLESEPGSSTRNAMEQERQRLIAKACKAAVKANDRLDALEIVSLLRSLDRAENPFSCPHGRPTFLRFEQKELEKMFLRK